ncbi:MAG TPA: ABC transporter permease [Candidatus Acidoferrales bacterium]|nr:ABC transporter permease [Candidatus Acidoferrales bacterium]
MFYRIPRTGGLPTGILSHIIRRLILLVPVIIGVTFISFVISFLSVPDPVRAWTGPRATAGAIAAMTARFHLHDPIYVQYYYYLVNMVTGNWGLVPSTGRPVLSDIELFFPATLELAFASLIISILIGIPLGLLAAMYQGRIADHSIRLFYLAGYCSPPFFVALMLILVFGYMLGWLPTEGQLSMFLIPPTRITGMVIVDSLLTGNWPDFVDAVQHIILPATSLSLLYFGIITRVTRASLLEVFHKDFIRAAYAKGLGERTVLIRHGLRNAMIPTVTILGVLLGGLLAGSIVIETIFQWPGIGLYLEHSILAFDFPSVVGVSVIITFGVVIANLVADILYAIIDPRIKI